MSIDLTCWQCGESLGNVIFPMSRREECGVCNADQHVCMMCKDYDGNGGCNESRAEHVSDTQKANFCDYFSPSGKAFEKVGNQRALDAKAQLAALFGDEPDYAGTNNSGTIENGDSALTPAQLAEKKLREMLGD